MIAMKKQRFEKTPGANPMPSIIAAAALTCVITVFPQSQQQKHKPPANNCEQRKGNRYDPTVTPVFDKSWKCFFCLAFPSCRENRH